MKLIEGQRYAWEIRPNIWTTGIVTCVAPNGRTAILCNKDGHKWAIPSWQLIPYKEYLLKIGA